jgi:hypothetical protein
VNHLMLTKTFAAHESVRPILSAPRFVAGTAQNCDAIPRMSWDISDEKKYCAITKTVRDHRRTSHNFAGPTRLCGQRFETPVFADVE